MSTAHTPGAQDDLSLSGRARASAAEVQEPSLAGEDAGSGGPVRIQLHVTKRITAGKGRICLCRIHQTREFLKCRQPPT